MKVLIACEESQVVAEAFINAGHDAMSCDLQPGAKGLPHYKGDVRDLLDEYFDLVIFHPPCTYISNSGVRWLTDGNVFYYDRVMNLAEATAFFMLRDRFNSPMVCTENPIPHKYSLYGCRGVVGIGQKYDQIIQPWQFGHGETKATCLWLKNLPLLKPTNIVEGREGRVWKMAPGPERVKLRSKTYPGIAKAMAEQWS